jgi:hypothetical protein
LTDLLAIEHAAARLRQCLRNAPLAELKILCALRFAELLIKVPDRVQEPFLREFVPPLAQAAAKCRPQEFLPTESLTLKRLVDHLRNQNTSVVVPDDLAVISGLCDKTLTAESLLSLPNSDPTIPVGAVRSSAYGITLRCLFVEHHPELGIEGRARILDLTVSASSISNKLPDDDVVLRNPLFEPDDSFRQQALQSIAAARQHLYGRYKLPLNKRYRFDFAIDSSGARFTGDSLGVAFAVGAIATLARLEVLRDLLSISHNVAFSGALSPEGELLPIDSEGLKLKVYRAFYSPIRFLIIPHTHLIDALKYEQELETECPGRRLELVGADTLDQVASDPRLVPVERSSAVTYAARKVWRAKRSPLVEVPALAVLAAIFYVLALPYLNSNPSFVRAEKNGISVYNKYSHLLWQKAFTCSIDTSLQYSSTVLYDLNGDDTNEVAVIPYAESRCPEANRLFVFNSRGDTLYTRPCFISEAVGTDSTQRFYESPGLYIEKVDGVPTIVTLLYRNDPAQVDVKIWSVDGRLRGWYVNWGGCSLALVKDVDGDGIEDLWFMTCNNRMACSGFFVIRADSSFGVSPPYTEAITQTGTLQRGNQLRYTLFPTTDVGRFCLPTSFNHVKRLAEIASNKYEIVMIEGPDLWAYYDFDNKGRVIKTYFTSQFEHRRDSLVQAKVLPSISWEDYQDSLIDAVLHWTDTGWIIEGQLQMNAE